ncbi:MAG: hypothetical protein AB7T07_09495 [Steroidobacteraceae bacterium]
MKKLFVSFALAVGLGACATYQPVPKDYSGPTASVKDSGFSEDGTKAQMFALVAIDGNRVPNAFTVSASASYGRGASLTAIYPARTIQARPMKVTLRGSHATGAPIHAMASQLAGTFFSVEGTVDFSPEADRQYLVKGELKKEKSSVWIEDTQTGKPVTEVVSK